VEGRILELLTEGALTQEQLAASLRTDEGGARSELDDLRGRGFVELSTVTPHDTEAKTPAVYWRITDSGRAHLEQLRTQE
jgi:predicted ArsR family transcriptional regulator